MSLGIKFRRNKKAQLTDIQPAEIVYAVDTDEWGLGLADNSVEWRTHFKEFYNILLSGSEIPNNLLGEIGNVYVNTSDSLGIYIKGFTGWDYYPHAKDRAYINTNFLLNTNAPFNYDDKSTLIDVLATQVEMDEDHIPTNPQDAINFQYLDSLYFLLDDGTTQMVDGYEPTTPQQVVTKSTFNVFIPPTIMPTTVGMLWNDNGVPSISVVPKFCSGISHYSMQFAENPNDSQYRGFIEGSHGSLTLLSGQDLGITEIDMWQYEDNPITWIDAMPCLGSGKKYVFYTDLDVLSGETTSYSFNGINVPIFGNAGDTTLVEFKVEIVDTQEIS